MAKTPAAKEPNETAQTAAAVADQPPAVDAAAAPEAASENDAAAPVTEGEQVAAATESEAAAADEAAQAAGFASAEAKAAFDAEAAKPKPRTRRPRAKKDGGFSVKMPGIEAFEELRAIAAAGGRVALALADGRREAALARSSAALGTKRNIVINASAASFAGAGLERALRVSHVFALPPDAKPNAAPLAIMELSAPVTLQPGEQLSFGAGMLAFVPPAA